MKDMKKNQTVTIKNFDEDDFDDYLEDDSKFSKKEKKPKVRKFKERKAQ